MNTSGRFRNINLLMNIRRRVILPFLITFVIILGTAFAAVNYMQHVNEETFYQQQRQEIEVAFKNAIDTRVNFMHALVDFVSDNRQIQQAWLDKDRDALIELSSNNFQHIRYEHNITHFYFHNIDKTNFLRMHRSYQYGDKIERYTLDMAEASGKSASGLEFGELGLFVLRVVYPWYIDDQLVGYIEMGEEIELLIDALASINNVNMAIVIDTEVQSTIRNKSKLPLRELIDDHTQIENELIVLHSTDQQLAEYIYSISHTHLTSEHGTSAAHLHDHNDTPDGGRSVNLGHWSDFYSLNQRSFFVSAIDIFNAEKRSVGHIVFNKDITDIEHTKRLLFSTTFIAVLLVALICCLFYFWYSGKLQHYLKEIYVALDDEVGKRRKSEEKLANYSRELEMQVEQRTQELVKTNIELEKDIELRKKTEEDFRKSETKYRTLFEKTPEATLLIDGNNFVDCNDATVDMLRYKSKDEVLNSHPSVLSPNFQPDGRESREKAEEMMQIAFENGSHRFEWDHKRANGEVFPVEVLLTSIPMGNRNVLYTVWRDISDRRKSEETIKHQAYYDSLTNLPNRILLNDRLQQAIIHANRYKNHGAVMFLDLDKFKNVNDSLGHSIGDALLVEVADRIQSCLREGDTAARLGGDEFVVLLPDLPQDENAYTYAEKVAEKIKNVIFQPLSIEHYELKISTSIGISLFGGKNEAIDDLLRHADTAMYRAKEDGRNAIRFFLPSMQAEVLKRLTLEKELTDALDKQEFKLHYQPQYTAEQNLFGVEALVRWQHPKHGMVPPLEFIEVAEEIGLIIPLSNWIMKKAMTDIRDLMQLSGSDSTIRLAINLSPFQFLQEDLIDHIERSLEKTGFSANLLTLEITENAIINDIEDTIVKCTELQNIGIDIALDDFGTGYSSLSYLKRLPINEIKIDRSFVRDIETDPNDAILVESIISMGQHFGLDIVAEGVETLEQLNFLRNQNCDAYQGYYFSKPLAIEELKELYLNLVAKSKLA